jgi:hypothetical protein
MPIAEFVEIWKIATKREGLKDTLSNKIILLFKSEIEIPKSEITLSLHANDNPTILRQGISAWLICPYQDRKNGGD